MDTQKSQTDPQTHKPAHEANTLPCHALACVWRSSCGKVKHVRCRRSCPPDLTTKANRAAICAINTGGAYSACFKTACVPHMLSLSRLFALGLLHDTRHTEFNGGVPLPRRAPIMPRSSEAWPTQTDTQTTAETNPPISAQRKSHKTTQHRLGIRRGETAPAENQGSQSIGAHGQHQHEVATRTGTATERNCNNRAAHWQDCNNCEGHSTGDCGARLPTPWGRTATPRKSRCIRACAYAEHNLCLTSQLMTMSTLHILGRP